MVARLERQARRGRIADFEPGAFGGLFAVEAFATPFDYRVVAHAERASVGDGGAAGTRLRFALVRLKKIPWIFGVTLALTVWPGVWLTHSLLQTYFSWYNAWTTSMPWLTYAWYLPLTAGPIPWMWRTWTRKSRAMAEASAAETIEMVEDAIRG